mgnify:CR=1 FL=1
MIILIGKNFDYGAMAKYHADLVGKKEETADGDEEIKSSAMEKSSTDPADHRTDRSLYQRDAVYRWYS